MASSTAEPPTNLVRALAAWAFPWLLSTSAHTVLLLVLAVTFGWTASVQRGTNSEATLVVTLVHSESGGGNGTDAARDSSAGGQYYDDEPAPLERRFADSREGGGAGDAASLRSLLNEKPQIDLAGVLPASATGVGSGAADGGVGSARGLTGEPQGSTRMRGGYARTGVFGVVGEGYKFVYVFDRSGSMDGHGGAPLSAAKAQLIASLKDLGQTHQFQIIFYNDHPRVFNPTGVLGRLVFGTDQNKALAQRFVGSITADGATRHEEALEMALRLVPDVIFFLTDADEPRLSTQQLAHLAQRNKGTSINTIEFGYGPQSDSDNFLVKLARQNGGKHAYVDVSQLPTARR